MSIEEIVTYLKCINCHLLGFEQTLDEKFLKKQSVFKDFANVRYKVTRSNVMDYGDFKVGSSKLSSFLGYRKSNGTTAANPAVTVPTKEKVRLR